ncbi:MAG: sigma-70 family RNA polymerase sigma factor [Anaerolineae bacterium]
MGDEALAEDLTAAVFERALVAIERFEVRGVPFVAWLYRIAGNLIANHHRRLRLISFVPFLPNAVQGAQSSADLIDERTAVREAFHTLAEGDREVLSLRYHAGLTPPEIADVLGCSPAAVHKRLHRARQRLRQQLEETTVSPSTRPPYDPGDPIARWLDAGRRAAPRPAFREGLRERLVTMPIPVGLPVDAPLMAAMIRLARR